ncbi:MAG: dTDP-4-dehydrorhamnose reductase family protein [Solirubrobacteraceae bacterium]
MPATRVLVLGATGMLGHEASRVLADRHDVHAAARDLERAHAADLPVTLHHFDALAPDSLRAVLDAAAPDVVLNAVGLVKQLEEASRPVRAITLNSLLPHRLAEACSARGARLLHVSTDCVFAGTLAPPAAYTEADVPDARDLYGRSKLLGEVTAPGHLTLRTSIIGRELGRVTGLLEWFLHESGPQLGGFTHAYFSGLTTRALARVIDELITDHPDLTGLYHVSSEAIDKHRLLSLLDAALERGHEIRPLDEPRINRALDSSRFRAATGIEIPSWEAMAHELATERAA